jgi:hypothetical protein
MTVCTGHKSVELNGTFSSRKVRPVRLLRKGVYEPGSSVSEAGEIATILFSWRYGNSKALLLVVWSLIRNKKTIVLFEKTAMQL